MASDIINNLIQKYPNVYKKSKETSDNKIITNHNDINLVINDLSNILNINKDKFKYSIINPNESPINININSQIYSKSYKTIEFFYNEKWNYIIVINKKLSDKDNIDLDASVYEQLLVFELNRIRNEKIKNLEQKINIEKDENEIKKIESELNIEYNKMINDSGISRDLDFFKKYSYLANKAAIELDEIIPKKLILKHSGKNKSIFFYDYYGLEQKNKNIKSKSYWKTDVYTNDLNYRISLKYGKRYQLSSSTKESPEIFKASIKLYENHEKNDLNFNKELIIKKMKDNFISIKTKMESTKITNILIDEYSKFRESDLKIKYKNKISNQQIKDQIEYDLNILDIRKNRNLKKLNIIENNKSQIEKIFKDWFNNIYLKSQSFKNNFGELGEDVLKRFLEMKEFQADFENTINDILNKNKHLYKWLIYEATTGLYKFTGQAEKLADERIEKDYLDKFAPVTNYVMTFDSGGIIGFKEIKKQFGEEYIDKIKLAVVFKFASSSIYNSLRLLVNESLDDFFYNNYNKINEDLNIKQLFNDFVDGLKDLKTDVVDFFSEFIKKIKNWIYNFVDYIIENIKKLFDKGFDYFLEVCGLKYDENTIKLEFEDFEL